MKRSPFFSPSCGPKYRYSSEPSLSSQKQETLRKNSEFPKLGAIEQAWTDDAYVDTRERNELLLFIPKM